MNRRRGSFIWPPSLITLRADKELIPLEELNKKSLSERDICTKFITPALIRAGWDVLLQVREELTFTDGRIIVRGGMAARSRQKKRADYVLS